jgi:hypothetical protein
MTSDVGGIHLPESLSGPCRCLRYRELKSTKVPKPTSRVRGQQKPFGVLGAQSQGGAFKDEVTDVAARPRSLKDRTSSFYFFCRSVGSTSFGCS